MNVLGITGWSGSGKTTLIVALIPRLRALGLTVSTLKHAHHDVDLDRPGKDTFRHREAGAQEVILSTGRRWALLHELRDETQFNFMSMSFIGVVPWNSMYHQPSRQHLEALAAMLR